MKILNSFQRFVRSIIGSAPQSLSFRGAVCAVMFGALFFTFTPTVSHAASNAASAVFNGSSTADQGGQKIENGMNTVLFYVYLAFKIIAVGVLGWSMLELRNGEISKGVFGIIAAIGLFFSPALVDFAQNLGKTVAS